MAIIKINKDLPPLKWYKIQKYKTYELRIVQMAIVFKLTDTIQMYYEIDSEKNLHCLNILVINKEGQYTRDRIGISLDIEELKRIADEYREYILNNLFNS